MIWKPTDGTRKQMLKRTIAFDSPIKATYKTGGQRKNSSTFPTKKTYTSIPAVRPPPKGRENSIQRDIYNKRFHRGRNRGSRKNVEMAALDRIEDRLRIIDQHRRKDFRENRKDIYYIQVEPVPNIRGVKVHPKIILNVFYDIRGYGQATAYSVKQAQKRWSERPLAEIILSVGRENIKGIEWVRPYTTATQFVPVTDDWKKKRETQPPSVRRCNMKRTVKPAPIRESVMDLYGNSEVAQLYDQVGVQNNIRLPGDHISWIGIDKNGKHVVKITYISEKYGDIGEHAEVGLDYAFESFPDMLYKHVLEFESFTYHKPKYWALLRWAKERSIVKEEEARVTKEAK
jgi:hypothetical protein